MQRKLNDSNSKNDQLQKELDAALQDAKNTEAHAQSVLDNHK